jgi:hypothetical protein
LRQAAAELDQSFPELAGRFRLSLPALAARLKLAGGPARDDSFWKSLPPMVRPLAGYMHMHLQNADFSRQAAVQCLEMLERVLSALV